MAESPPSPTSHPNSVVPPHLHPTRSLQITTQHHQTISFRTHTPTHHHTTTSTLHYSCLPATLIWRAWYRVWGKLKIDLIASSIILGCFLTRSLSLPNSKSQYFPLPPSLPTPGADHKFYANLDVYQCSPAPKSNLGKYRTKIGSNPPG